MRIEGSRRETVNKQREIQLQEKLFNEIQLSKESRDIVAEARAVTLKAAEDRGVAIKAPRGNRAQWHTNFLLDEVRPPESSTAPFPAPTSGPHPPSPHHSPAPPPPIPAPIAPNSRLRCTQFVRSTRELRVLQPRAGCVEGACALELRGLLVLGPGHTLADACKMLLTELQLCPAAGWWQISAVSHDGTSVLRDLSCVPPFAEVLPLLPSEPCSLLVRNCLPPNRLLTMTLTSEAADVD